MLYLSFVILNFAMGNIFASCFTPREEPSDHEQNSDSSADRISDLPDEILHLILSFLPFKSVGQTPILTRRWNDIWSSYPIIDFYEIFTSSEADHQQIRTGIIDAVLARHEKSYYVLNPCLKISLPRARGGLNNLSRVDELVLDILLNTENRYNLPQCQFRCHSLKSSSCGKAKTWLGFPSSYVVESYLRSLHTLSLFHVDFSDSRALDVDLFSGSSFPYLEKLILRWCRGKRDLKICCPNLKRIEVVSMDLKSLDISGMRLEELEVWFCFKECTNGRWVNVYAPNLQSFSWQYSGVIEWCSTQSFPLLRRSIMEFYLLSVVKTKKININSVVDLLCSSSQVEEFDISNGCLQILSEIYFDLGGLPFSFMKLKTLRIRATPMKGRYIPGMACLFKSSPVVDSLYIWFHSYKENKWNNTYSDDANCNQEQHWESQAQYLSPFLSHVKEAKICLAEMIPESAITFAKFVIKYGKNLQKMRVSFHTRKSSVPPESLSKLIALKRSSRLSAVIKVSTHIAIEGFEALK